MLERAEVIDALLTAKAAGKLRVAACSGTGPPPRVGGVERSLANAA